MFNVEKLKNQAAELKKRIPGGDIGITIIDMEKGESMAALPDHIRNDPDRLFIIDNIVNGEAVKVEN
jgi:hypothetical protein